MSLAFFVDWRIPLSTASVRSGSGSTSRDSGSRSASAASCRTSSRSYRPRDGRRALRAVSSARVEVQLDRGDRAVLQVVPPAVGTQNIVFDLPATRVPELLEALKLFGRDHIASLMYDFADSQYLMGFGREEEAPECSSTCGGSSRSRISSSGARRSSLEGDVRRHRVLARLLYPYEFGERALEAAKELEELDVRVWAMAADEVRMLHYALRGETDEVHHYRERVELFAVQGSTTWQADIFWPILLHGRRDARRRHHRGRTIREQLARRAKDHPSLRRTPRSRISAT